MSEPATIAWIDAPAPTGSWGPPTSLALPLADRGLLLADGVFETVLVLDGRPQLLGEHLQRWRQGAALLGLEPPPPASRIAPLIAEAIQRAGLSHGRRERGSGSAGGSGALRLNWSRGIPGEASWRGIAMPPRCQHRFWLQLTPGGPTFTPVQVVVSASERRDPLSLLSRCKTFAYGSAIQARREAAARGADDALLTSVDGTLSCGTSANLLLRQGERWLTPPLASGCLPGVMRARALGLGLAMEAELTVADLAASNGALLLNSLSCRPVAQLLTAAGPQKISWSEREASNHGAGLADTAQRIWRQLL